MVLAHIFAGLGNQLFQYAAAHELALRLGTAVRADLSWFDEPHRSPRAYRLPELGLPSAVATAAERAAPFRRPRWFARLRPGWTQVRQIGGEVPLGAFRTARGPVFLKGYWQGEAFFPAFKGELARRLLACAPLAADARWLAAVRAPGAIALHVRRGDYLTATADIPHYRVLPPDYYRAALRALAPAGEATRAVVFSDDPAWCAAHLALGVPTLVVERASSEASAAADLLCLAQARALVTANSTFSWWAAWIATQRGGARVVAPAVWFDDPDYAEWQRQLRVPGWMSL
ncbi:MAG: hypothetical protein RLZZ15_795 [Verrucomicrobiota bacterium]